MLQAAQDKGNKSKALVDTQATAPDDVDRMLQAHANGIQNAKAEENRASTTEDVANTLQQAGQMADAGVKAAMVVTAPQYAVMGAVVAVDAAPAVGSAVRTAATAVNDASTSLYVRASTALGTAGAAIENGARAAQAATYRAAVWVDSLKSGGGAFNAAGQIFQAATSNRTPPAPNKFGAIGFAIKVAIKLYYQ